VFYFITGFFLFSVVSVAEEFFKDLPQKKIFLCDQVFLAWIAKNDETRQRGLMNFRQLKDNEGMLFIFDEEEERTFWMKNVPYDLDIAFFKKDKKLLSKMTMKGTSPLTQETALPIYQSGGRAQFALEVAGGRLKKLSKKCLLKF
jgi:uncharacterized membrane protein (UPF0127 family)